jgi:plastocyanin
MYAESPSVDGYVVGMEAEVVDAAGRVQGRDKVMLHHIVFAKIGVPDYTCGGFTERFFAEGEERLALSLPRGYGYANKGTDRWGLLFMLMNHKPQRLNGFIRYTVRYVTGEALTPVKPVWLDVRNCSGGIDPVFDVPGGGKRFSTFTKTGDFTMPEGGRLISGGGHLHGGGVRLELRNASCGTVPFTSRPTWGGPKPKPLLHEPGPTKMSAFRSTAGIPVAKGQTLRLAAVYDNEASHTRAMGIMLLFLAPAVVQGCGATPALDIDLGKPSAPPPFSMPLPRAPTGPISTAKSTIVGDFKYGSERVSLKRGTTFTWRFLGQFQHDVTVVGGPEGFSAPWSLTGVFTHRFTKPGTYRLFCSLHPAKMVQQITVR